MTTWRTLWMQKIGETLLERQYFIQYKKKGNTTEKKTGTT